MLGPNAKLARRVAIRTKDVLTLRDLQERSKITRCSEREQRKASQQDIDKLEARVSREAQFKGSAALDAMEQARQIVTGVASSRAAGGPGSAFSSDGKAAAALGQLKDTFGDIMEEDEVEDPEPEEDGDMSMGGNTGGDNTSSTSAKAKGKAKDKDAAVTWFNRDEKVSDELAKHRQWELKTRGKFASLISRLEEAKLKETPETAAAGHQTHHVPERKCRTGQCAKRAAKCSCTRRRCTRRRCTRQRR
eukprot:9326169-Lingulodinium_polyedra.AAC.1